MNCNLPSISVPWSWSRQQAVRYIMKKLFKKLVFIRVTQRYNKGKGTICGEANVNNKIE